MQYLLNGGLFQDFLLYLGNFSNLSRRVLMSKANICLIGLSNGFVDKYALELSKKLDMFYANASEIIQFELFDKNRMEEVCGREYLEKEEGSILRRICTYENTIVNAEYHLLNNDANYKFVKDNCLIIYLKIDLDRYKKEMTDENMSESSKFLNLDLFKDRNFICEKKAELIVNCKDLENDDLTSEILKKILSYYEV